MYGTAVTTGAISTNKGTAVELIASTNFDAYWVKLTAGGYGVAATASQGCFDLLIGAATESILIADMLMGHCGGDTTTSADVGPKTWEFPLYIPAGSRLAAQAAGVRTALGVYITVELWGGDGYPAWPVGSRVTTYGMGTVPRGTTITPGASGAAGSWTQITASTSYDHIALVPSFQVATDTTVNRRHITVEMGVGAATEELISHPYFYQTGTNEFMAGAYNGLPTFCNIPASSRLVMRASNGGTNDAAYDGVIHAVS